MLRGILNKILLSFLLCILFTPYTALSSLSSIGGDILKCLENPCDCGCSGKTETWNGATHTYESNCNCPPYLKTERNGCLKNRDLPELFNIFFNNYCAEMSPVNDFFTPKIRVRIQTCNIACWTLQDDLAGDGSCTEYPGPIGIPLTRICSRLALPDDPTMPTPADDGYSYGWHLNWEGAPELDPILEGADGQPVYIARPKVCAYWDPSFWDALANYVTLYMGPTIKMHSYLAQIVMVLEVVGGSTLQEVMNNFQRSTGTSNVDNVGDRGGGVGNAVLRGVQGNFQPDLWDLNPVKQSMHFHEGGIFLLFQWIIDLFKLGFSGIGLLDGAIGKMPGNSMWYWYEIGVLYWLLWAILYIGENIIIPALEYLGQLNNVVISVLGCVLVPMGPNPPPYCNPLVAAPQPPQVHEICQTTIMGQKLATLPSSSTNKCVNSTVSNNVISNAIRVGFDQMIPVCTGTQVPGSTCVNIHGSPLPSSLHAMTKSLDIMNICSSATPAGSELPCAESPSFVGKTNIRVVYAYKASSSKAGHNLVNTYFDTELPDCTVKNTSMCQMVWGVNLGSFVDLAVIFPSVETSYTIAQQISSHATIFDVANTAVSVQASVVRTTTSLPNGMTLDAKQICVFDSFNDLLGCAPRPVPPKPVVYECGAPGTNARCTSTFLNPKMVAKLQVGAYSTEGALSVATTSGVGAKINLAGFDYDSFATDANYNMVPFDGTHSINPNSIYGNYENGAAPYDSKGVATNAVYLDGLEYSNGKYVIGGETICLKGYKFDDCLTGKTNTSCVLTSIINSDFVRCTKFYNDIQARYTGITLCNATQLASYTQTKVFSEPHLSGGTNNIKVLSGGKPTSYCYTYTSNTNTGDLCKIGQTTASRVFPLPADGDILPDDDYYNYSRTLTINGDTLALRNKTAMEFGLCIDIPQPAPCAAVTSSQAPSNGYATWTSVGYGQPSVGTCLPGYMNATQTPMQRNCVVNKSTGFASLEPLPVGMNCVPGTCSFAFDQKPLILDEIRLEAGSGYGWSVVYNTTATSGTVSLYNSFIKGRGLHKVQIPFTYTAGFQPATLSTHVAYGPSSGSSTVTLNGTQVLSGSPSTYASGGWVTRYDTGIYVDQGGDHTDTSSPITDISSVQPVNGSNTLEFDLNALGPSYIVFTMNYSCPPPPTCAVQTNFSTAQYTDTSKIFHLETPVYSTGAGQAYDLYFKFNVQDVNSIPSFSLQNIYYGDFVLITLNGNRVFAGGDRNNGPDGINSITQLKVKPGTNCTTCGANWSLVEYDNNGSTTCANHCTWWTLAPNLDLKNFLVNGQNEMHVITLGGNHTQVKLDLLYNINGCTAITQGP